MLTCANLDVVSLSQFSLEEDRASDQYWTGKVAKDGQREPSLGFNPEESLWL